MVFDTKIAVVVRADLPVWQKLNVTAFTVSGIAGTVDGAVGEPYRDASGILYLPMFRQPVRVFAADADKLRLVYERARRREVVLSVFTEELFGTTHDEDNRAAVAAVPSEQLRLVGLAFRAENKTADKVLKGVPLHP